MQQDILTRPHLHGKWKSSKKDCCKRWRGVYVKDCDQNDGHGLYLLALTQEGEPAEKLFGFGFLRGDGGMEMEKLGESGRSHVRWVVLLLLCLMYLITYLDRVSLANTATLIMKEYGFSKVTMGVIFSAFIWALSLIHI